MNGMQGNTGKIYLVKQIRTYQNHPPTENVMGAFFSEEKAMASMQRFKLQNNRKDDTDYQVEWTYTWDNKE